MAKRKNPLKDLDAFLKQEAKNFVQPNRVTEKTKEEEVAVPAPKKQEVAPTTLSKESVMEYMANLSQSSNKEFYDIVKKSLEKSGLKSAEDKMLINTLLYLNDKTNWKENIKAYWS
jgi:restriction endonuclease Mrr